MPDYTPVFLPGLTMTSQAAGNITGGDPVEVAGSSTVQTCSASSSPKYVGVAGADAKAGADVTVIADSVVHEGAADGQIIAGDQLVASAKPGCQVAAAPPAALSFTTWDASSAAAVNAAISTARAVMGLALNNAVDGGTVRWMQK